MENIQTLNEQQLAMVDGSGAKAWIVIGVATLICPVLGVGMAVGYIINS